MIELKQSDRETLAAKLYEANETNKQIKPLSKTKPNISIEDAYTIQLMNIDKRESSSNKRVGKKIGLTSKAMQESLGVNEPDYGILLKDMEIDSSNPVVKKDSTIQPRVEGELAFILKSDLKGPNITVEDVLKATESIVPSIEIVDSRVENWNITIKDTIADNASSAYYILGENYLSPEEANRIEVEMTLYKNGEEMNKGTGKDVLGDPAKCVAWLANKMNEYNITLEKGDVILAGALSAAISAEPGDTFTCQFTEGFGDVSIQFEK